MVIVLIHWKIKRSAAAVAQFKDWWQGTEFDDDSGLFGEFLSSPIRADELTFESDDLHPRGGTHLPYVNVGVWRDIDTFDAQVGKYFDDSLPPREFEAERRSRVVLTPEHWRLGTWGLSLD